MACKRQGYISWDEYFMGVAELSSKRSKDPVTQVGACIVNRENRIVSTGYNGAPNGWDDDKFPWGKEEDVHKNKHYYVCHAEMNAIINKNSASLQNCVIYTTLFPCNQCAKIIIQSGIKEVVYKSDKHAHQESTIASKRMLNEVNIICRQL